jgi:hypothetical protein
VVDDLTVGALVGSGDGASSSRRDYGEAGQRHLENQVRVGLVGSDLDPFFLKRG